MIQCQLVVATAAEARPFIDHYKLKHGSGSPYRYYQNDRLSLVETGMGKLNAASATAAILMQHRADNFGWSPPCINIGIAGSDRPIGDLVAAHRICDTATDTQWFPQLVCNPPCATVSINTVDVPSTEYRQDIALEMEASGVILAASKFMTAEFIHCFKIISDNPEHPVGTVNREAVRTLVQDQLVAIDQFMQQLISLSAELPDTASVDQLLSHLGPQLRISVSQRVKLRQLLLAYQAHLGKLPTTAALEGYQQASDLLSMLNTTLATTGRLY